jgi:hypothetical protein
MVVEPTVVVIVDPPVVSTETMAEVEMAVGEPPAPAYSHVSQVPIFSQVNILLLQCQCQLQHQYQYQWQQSW